MVKGCHGVEQVSDHGCSLPEGGLPLGQGGHGVAHADCDAPESFKSHSRLRFSNIITFVVKMIFIDNLLSIKSLINLYLMSPYVRGKELDVA